MPDRTLARRTLIAAFVATPLAWTRGHAQTATTPLPLTPAQTEGPFYPVELPADRDHDLLQVGPRRYTRGQPTWLEGRVLDASGRPVSGAQVEIWQCDEDGHYHHPGDRGQADAAFQGFGQVQVGPDGRYRFRTIRPAPYSGRTPHIHVKVRMGRRELLTTQLYVEGEPGNERDGLWRRLPPAERARLTVPFQSGPDGMRAEFPIVVQA